MNTKPQYPSVDFVTQVGKLVSGSLHIASDKDFHGKPRDKPQYWFAVAIPKVDPASGQPNQAILQLLGQIQQHAWDSYKNQAQGAGVLTAMQSGPIGALIPQGFRAPFAWKVENGDWPENAGKAGYAGNWILKFSGTFPPNVCDARNGQMNPATVPLGSYVQISASTEINGKFDATAGIYLNYRFVRVVAVADGVSIPIIQTGISAASAFGDQGYAGPMPAGVPAPGSHPVGIQATQAAYTATYGQQPAYGTPALQAAPVGPTAPAGVQMPPPPAGVTTAPQGHLQQQTGQVGVYTPGPAPAPGVPAGSVQAPAGAPAPMAYPAAQPTQAAPGYPTAYPSSAPAQQQYAQVQPHQAFVQGVQPPR